MWDPIRQRLKAKGSRLRGRRRLPGLFAAGCDRGPLFPILEYFGERAEELEEDPGKAAARPIQEIHQFKRDLLLVRWAIWPLREVVSGMQREEHECMSELHGCT